MCFNSNKQNGSFLITITVGVYSRILKRYLPHNEKVKLDTSPFGVMFIVNGKRVTGPKTVRFCYYEKQDPVDLFRAEEWWQLRR